MRNFFWGVGGRGIGVQWPKMTQECIICDPRSQKISGGAPPDPPKGGCFFWVHFRNTSIHYRAWHFALSGFLVLGQADPCKRKIAFLGTQMLLMCISHFRVSCLRPIPFAQLVGGCLTSAFQTTSQWFFTIHFLRLLAWFTIYSHLTTPPPPLIGSFYGTSLSDGGPLSVTRTQFLLFDLDLETRPRQWSLICVPNLGP